MFFPSIYTIILTIIRKAVVIQGSVLLQEKKMLGKYCRVSVVNPVGSADKTYGFIYPLNYGIASGKRIHIAEGTGAFILGINHSVREFEGRIIAIITVVSDDSKMLVVAPKSKKFIVHEIEKQLEFLRNCFDFEIECLYERSCGAVVFHKMNGSARFLLIKNKRSAHWSFPKGHVEKGESDEQTALREVKEETGIDVEIIKGFKAKSEYSIQRHIEKTVYIFTATCESTQTVIQPEEIEDYRWLDYHQAMRNLRFDNDKSILFRSREFLKRNKYI